MRERTLVNMKTDKIKDCTLNNILRENRPGSSSVSDSNLLVFQIGNEQKYAMDYALIDRVITDQTIVPVPGINPLFSGLLYYKAELWPVINTRVLFQCPLTNGENNFILLHDDLHRYAFSVGTIIGQISYDCPIELTYPFPVESPQHSCTMGLYPPDITIVNISTILNLMESVPIAPDRSMDNEHE
jgi:hypothetical protein